MSKRQKKTIGVSEEVEKLEPPAVAISQDKGRLRIFVVGRLTLVLSLLTQDYEGEQGLGILSHFIMDTE